MTCTNCGNSVPDTMKFCSKCGTPVTASHYSPPTYSAPSDWQASPPPPPIKRKSRTGKILLIVGIVLVLLVSGIGVAIYFGVSSYIRSTKSSPAYALAESTLRASQAVKDRLGELKSVGIPIGTFSEEADGTGFAVFFMSVEGEKANGHYVVEMARRNSVWRINTAVVKLESGEEIKVADTDLDIQTLKRTDAEPDANENQNQNQNQNTNTSNSNTSDQKSKVISGGVLNGKAISLPKPAYPPAAKSVRASGTVVVQVMIDEEGNVTSAYALSGHPLLQASAVAAARKARFSPTKLGGKPVKVSGVINYNFVAEP